MKRKFSCSNYSTIFGKKTFKRKDQKTQILTSELAQTSQFLLWDITPTQSPNYIYYVKYEYELTCKRISWDWAVFDCVTLYFLTKLTILIHTFTLSPGLLESSMSNVILLSKSKLIYLASLFNLLVGNNEYPLCFTAEEHVSSSLAEQIAPPSELLGS